MVVGLIQVVVGYQGPPHVAAHTGWYSLWHVALYRIQFLQELLGFK